MITLTKSTDSHKVRLDKTASEIVCTATWVDNGDARDDNDDLDLRAGILLPNGDMRIIHCERPGSFSNSPYAQHMGDVKSASVDAPGQEIIKVNPEIAKHAGGKVAIVFSVYSAIANGPVSIASLKPVMRIQYGDQIVDCELNFKSDQRATKKGVYTYVVGLVVIDGDEITVSPGGQVSDPTSEATPWLTWNAAGGADVTVDGPAVSKGSGGKFFAGLLNLGNKKKYVA